MAVTVIDAGRLVRVEPDALDENDILECAGALIDEHGHKKGDSGDATQGFSIHGAIGEAARRATGSSEKDSATARPLRDAAQAKVEAAHPGKTEFEVNDTAADKAAALSAIEAARAVTP